MTRFPGPNRSKAEHISGQVTAVRGLSGRVFYGLQVHDPVSGTTFSVKLTAPERRAIIAAWKEQDERAAISASGTRSRGGMPSRPPG